MTIPNLKLLTAVLRNRDLQVALRLGGVNVAFFFSVDLFAIWARKKNAFFLRSLTQDQLFICLKSISHSFQAHQSKLQS